MAILDNEKSPDFLRSVKYTAPKEGWTGAEGYCKDDQALSMIEEIEMMA